MAPADTTGTAQSHSALHDSDGDAVTDPGMGAPFEDALLGVSTSFDFFTRTAATPELPFALSDSTDALASFGRLPSHDDLAAHFLAPGASQLIPELPGTAAETTPPPPHCEPSALSALSPRGAPLDGLSESRTPTPPPLRVGSAIRKPPRGSAASLGSPVTLVRAPRTPVRVGGASVAAARSAAARDKETRRLQHNEMMRVNRERTNKKFTDLETLLRSCARDAPPRQSMRNKMQVLDRAMTQYPAMRARRASLRAALLLGAARDAGAAALLAASRAPATAADTLARLLLGAQGWKGAEVWTRASGGAFALCSALASAQNMVATARALRMFSSRVRRTRARDALVERAARLPASLWVPDLRALGHRVARAADAARAGVSTALYVPVAHDVDGVATAVVVLYHADDELVSHTGGVRLFDADEVARVDDLASAVRHTARLAG